MKFVQVANGKLLYNLNGDNTPKQILFYINAPILQKPDPKLLPLLFSHGIN